ncbi:MAG: recombination protein O N-terminal domain-containing protein [Bacteroidales bacterium]|nr:recombination protein O N-terminal domain-containing protein [Bacteroidales bacterium]
MGKVEQTMKLVVLHTTKLGDNSLMLHTLTEKGIKESFVVKGLKKTHASVYFSPLSLISAQIVPNSRSTISLAHHFAFISPLEGIAADFTKTAISIFIAEVLFKLSQCEIPFEWLSSQILGLNEATEDVENFHIGFLISLCEVLGFKITPNALAEFGGEGIKESLAKAPANGQARTRLCNAVIAYLSYNLDIKITINSLGVLSEIMR